MILVQVGNIQIGFGILCGSMLFPLVTKKNIVSS